MSDVVFAFTVPKPECEAVIVFQDISWPIPSEAKAYDLAKRSAYSASGD